MDLAINVEETKESVVRRQIHVNDVKSSGGLSFEESHETDQKKQENENAEADRPEETGASSPESSCKNKETEDHDYQTELPMKRKKTLDDIVRKITALSSENYQLKEGLVKFSFFVLVLFCFLSCISWLSQKSDEHPVLARDC